MFFDSIKLKKGAWHWRLHRLASRIGFPEPEYFLQHANFCPYYWLTLLYMLLLVPAGIIAGIVWILVAIARGMRRILDYFEDIKEEREEVRFHKRKAQFIRDFKEGKWTRKQLKAFYWNGYLRIKGGYIDDHELFSTDEAAVLEREKLREQVRQEYEAMDERIQKRNAKIEKFFDYLLFPLVWLVQASKALLQSVVDGISNKTLAWLVKFAQRTVMAFVFIGGAFLFLWLYWNLLVFIGRHEETIVMFFWKSLTYGSLGVAIACTLILAFIWIRYAVLTLFDYLVDVKFPSLPSWMYVPFKFLWRIIVLTGTFIGNVFKFIGIGFMSWKKDNCPAIIWEE